MVALAIINQCMYVCHKVYCGQTVTDSYYGGLLGNHMLGAERNLDL